MKKLLSVIIAMIMTMSFFTGCVDNEPSANPDPTPTPTATPTPPPADEGEDPNYPTVLAMWKDMDGYWADDDGEYLYFTLDENGKAVMYAYDEYGKVENVMKATAVMSSNKTSYYMAFDLPEIKAGEGTLPEFTQKAGTRGFMIELAGYGDGYVSIAEEKADDYDFEIYVKVGENLEKLQDAVKQAEKLEKDD